jgi:hypothetical protein
LQQAGQGEIDAAKLGLLWTAEWLLQQRTLDEMRAFFDHVLSNPLLLPAFPDYLNGFVLALNFAPQVASFLVELLSKLFASAPDSLLMPWLPGLIIRLRPHGRVLQTLVKEAAAHFPSTIQGLDGWQAPWTAGEPAEVTPVADGELTETETAVRALLLAEPAATQALAHLLAHLGHSLS